MILQDEKYQQAIISAAIYQASYFATIHHYGDKTPESDYCNYKARAQEELIADLFGVRLADVGHDVLEYTFEHLWKVN